MKSYFLAYIITGGIFAVMDAVWLSLMAGRLYKPVLHEILAPKVQAAPAIIFYLLYILGLVIFAVAPGLAAGRWSAALWRGALFGLFTYMTYDLTNQATMRVWATSITAADIGWGMAASATAATLGCAALLALR
ncbi:DUF2177 family protein [Acidocella sp.]|uniref:DUF2177 family protein n=1 Tax=Acidocella sp. TaxID=50710 RepID=UPI00262E54A2|nr:DUF2177 family protein [Acidocella sp.]